MHYHDGTQSSVPALETKSRGESIRTLAALPALPTTKSMTATAVEARSNVSLQHLTPSEATGLPAAQSVETTGHPPTPVQAKPRNVYLVAAFCSLGGFLFGADTGERC